MEQDFFTYLPSEIIINILSRLPIRTTMSCKCVCKPWLDLLVTPEFVKSHLSKSVPGLAIFDWETQSKTNKIIEFEDEVDGHCWNVVFNFDLPFYDQVRVHSSANGLFFLYKGAADPEFFLCNPVTREYITIPPPSSKAFFRKETYGFGVRRMSGQYTVVRMFLDENQTLPQCRFDQFDCQVYTVGTGSWRRIASDKGLWHEEDRVGAFLNGNLHFLARERISSSRWISCIDLETEHFSRFSLPPLDYDPLRCRSLSVLKGCLCVCENSTHKVMSGEINIWLMNEYGDEKSWAKEFVIHKVNRADYLGFICPIKVFKDGSILMELGSNTLLYYSSKSKTIRHVNLSGLRGSIISSSTAVYAPTFLPLKTFAMENVSSF